MKLLSQSLLNKISIFSANSLYERTNTNIPSSQALITQAQGNEIIRIIHSAGRTFVSVREKHINKIQAYIRTNDITKKLCNHTFYLELLNLLNYNPDDFLLEPSEEFLQDIKYNCVHMLDYTCAEDLFIPQNSNQVEHICREDERFILDTGFDDTMYCITDKEKIISCSYYKPNKGIFENTCSMQVFTRPRYRGNGYAKMTASAATQAIIEKGKLALWSCQVENLASRKTAEALGYMLIGGEIRIVK